MTTLDDYIARARTFLRDDAGRFVFDEDLTVWANEAIADLAARLRIFEESVVGTTSGNTIALPPGVSDPELVEIVSLRLEDGDDVEFVSTITWDSWSDTASVPNHTLGRVFDGNVELYPTPETGLDYELRYKRIPELLDDGSDVSEIPRHLDRKVIAYMAAQGCLKTGEDPTTFFAVYEQQLPPVSSGREKILPGPMQLVPELGPFELDEGYMTT